MNEPCRLQQPVLSQSMPEQEPRVHRICSEIAMNPSQSYSLADLAAMADISESHLRYLFRKHLGVSPMEFVRKARLRKARELLLGTSLQIQEISDMLGFLNPPAFTRAFRNEEGASPKEYRNKFHRI